MSKSEKKWCAYMHINKVNNKKYIGITSQKPTNRWSKNGAGYKHQPYFWSAIQKYGWDNFEHIIIIDNITKECACEIEKSLIKYYKSNNSQYGYNLTVGGENLAGEDCYWYGKKLSEAHKIKISQNHADFSGGKHPRAKPVYCIELERIFECTREAERKLNISHVAQCCNGNRNVAGGYHFMYLEDWLNSQSK